MKERVCIVNFHLSQSRLDSGRLRWIRVKGRA
jgi:hypothetical protein